MTAKGLYQKATSVGEVFYIIHIMHTCSVFGLRSTVGDRSQLKSRLFDRFNFCMNSKINDIYNADLTNNKMGSRGALCRKCFQRSASSVGKNVMMGSLCSVVVQKVSYLL